MPRFRLSSSSSSDSDPKGKASSSSSSDSEDEDMNPMKYDCQIILQVQEDNGLAQMASRLHIKHMTKSSQFTWLNFGSLDCMMGNPAPLLTTKTRMYLVGHGDTSCMHLAGKTGQYVAARLATLIPPGHEGVFISVVSCFSTATSEMRKPENFQQSINHNFAQQLHLYLKQAHGLVTCVSGRGVCVWVNEDDDGRIYKTTGQVTWDEQARLYVPNEPPQHKRPGDKIIYKWNENVQEYRYAY